MPVAGGQTSGGGRCSEEAAPTHGCSEGDGGAGHGPRARRRPGVRRQAHVLRPPAAEVRPRERGTDGGVRGVVHLRPGQVQADDVLRHGHPPRPAQGGASASAVTRLCQRAGRYLDGPDHEVHDRPAAEGDRVPARHAAGGSRTDRGIRHRGQEPQLTGPAVRPRLADCEATTAPGTGAAASRRR